MKKKYEECCTEGCCDEELKNNKESPQLEEGCCKN